MSRLSNRPFILMFIENLQPDGYFHNKDRALSRGEKVLNILGGTAPKPPLGGAPASPFERCFYALRAAEGTPLSKQNKAGFGDSVLKRVQAAAR